MEQGQKVKFKTVYRKENGFTCGTFVLYNINCVYFGVEYAMIGLCCLGFRGFDFNGEVLK